MVGKQINGEHNKHSKPIGDYRQKRTTTLGRSVGGSWIDIKCYQNIWPCDHLWSKIGHIYHVYGTPTPKMVPNTVLHSPNPVGTDGTKTTLCTGAFTDLKRQFKRYMTNGMMLLAMGHALHIWPTILPPMNSYTMWNKVTKIWKILSSISSWVNAWHVVRKTEWIMKKKLMWPIYSLGSTIGTLYKPVGPYTCVSTMFFIYNTPLEDDLRTPLTNSGCTRLQRPFKGYSTDGIMLQAIGYRP